MFVCAGKCCNRNTLLDMRALECWFVNELSVIEVIIRYSSLWLIGVDILKLKK